MQKRFIGRINELNYLKEKYNSPGQQFIIVHGRRRVGKSTLLREFVKHVGGIYHQAIESSEIDQLRYFSAQLSQQIDGYEQVFPSLENLLDYVFKKLSGKKKKSILIIDEFPYYTKKMLSFPSLLQLFLDRDETCNIMIIICGSEISTMQELMGNKSPLFGRKTGSLVVKPFKFVQISDFFPNTEVNILMKIYGTLGGMPNYLRMYNSKIGFEKNITKLFFEPGELSGEYINILKYEFSNISNYNAILRAISIGKTRINEISNEIGIDARLIPGYMNKLISVLLVNKILPMNSREKSRLTQYRITDNLISFHHHFFSSTSNISMSFSDIEDEFNAYMGYIFEKLTEEVLIELNSNHLIHHKNKPINLKHIGNWWKSDIEIDLVGKGKVGIVIECKYGNNIDGPLVKKVLSHKLPSTPWETYIPVIIARGYKKKRQNNFTFEELYSALKEGNQIIIS